jgi:hypothetical protein
MMSDWEGQSPDQSSPAFATAQSSVRFRFQLGVQCPTKKTAKAGVSLPALLLNRFGDRLEGELDP